MRWHEKINCIDFEISSFCNARCPQCPREQLIDKDWWSPKSLNLDFFQNRIGKEIFQEIKKVIFCGTYGDPSMAKDALGICQFVRNSNPDILIDFHTNGGTRNPEWWKSLANIIGQNGKVVWGFDGLQDTNHLYRIDVNWDRAWNNAMSFISAGGRAEWQFIIFKHNEHQVDEAKQLALASGFEVFIERQSSRFIQDLYFTGELRTYIPNEDRYIYPTDNPKYRHPFLNSQIAKIIKKNDLSDVFSIFDSITEINCDSKIDKKLYVTVDGYLMPCEHLAPATHYKDSSYPSAENFPEFNKQYPVSLIDLNNISFEEAVSSEWFLGLENSWKEKTCSGRLNTCVRNCGKK